MKQLEVLVEEPSAKVALDILLPRIVRGRARVAVRNFGSKPVLIGQLPVRLNAYRQRIQQGEDLRIMVLVDQDQDDCKALKQRLERMAADYGLPSKTRPDANRRFVVVNRIAVNELEAWFIGDPDALRATYTKLPPATTTGIFAQPDARQGKASVRLRRFLRKHGVYKGAYPKIEAARRIAVHLDPQRNRSRSFRHFVDGAGALLR